MINPGLKLDWRGSLGSLTGRRPLRTSSEEPDLLTGTRETSQTSETSDTPYLSRRARRKGLRKRFLSLTEGIASLFSTERKESLSRKGSKESLHSLRQPSGKRFAAESEEPNSGYSSDFSSEYGSHFRKHAGSLSSFRPSRPGAPEWKGVINNNEFERVRSPPLDRLKKAPPSPPPRRFSFWLNNSNGNVIEQNDPLAEAVISSSFTNLPIHLRPPPPPPPIRFCQIPSPPVFPSNEPFKEKFPPFNCNNRISIKPYLTANTKSPRVANSPSASRSSSPFFRDRSVVSERSCEPLTLSLHTPTPSIRAQTTTPIIRAQPKTASHWAFKLHSLNLKNNSSCGGAVMEKTVSIILRKENGTFGFTVRGGMSLDGVPRPLLVTHVRQGGPADREGTLKAGDRLVALDGRDLTRSSLSLAQMALQEVDRSATLAIRYDISVMDSVRCGGGPLLVEIERTPGLALGLTLNCRSSSFNNYSNQTLKSASSTIVIESIRIASIAERCGALAVGDVVCAIDGIRLDQITLKEANQLLKAGQGPKVTLEVIPNRNPTNLNGIRNGSPTMTSSSLCAHRFSAYNNTLGQNTPMSATTKRIQRRFREDSSLSPGRLGGVSHPEVVQATLLTEGRSIGLALRPSMDGTYPLVAALDPGGAADKSGVICVGDRILAVNGRSTNGLGVSEVTQMMANTRPTVIIDIELDVADSVIPSSGTFSVKLSKRQCSLGLKIAKARTPKLNEPLEEAILISDVVRGSSAHRSGTLHVGDKLLTIDNNRVDSLSLEEVRNLLEVDSDVVTLKVQKDDDTCSDDNSHVTYTVQLLRDGGALGINAAGSEEPFDPIYVGGIAPGSLAAQTGAIHIGDRLLAIDGVTLRGKPLSEAIRLLQGPEHTVALKISRPKEAGITCNGVSQEWLDFHAAPTLSVDSAVESWDSGGVDPTTNATIHSPDKKDSILDLFKSTGCGNDAKTRMTDEASSGNGDDRNQERKSWCSTSPSTDSGQSEDRTDWDKMIADLNQISATCGLREKSVLHHSNGELGISSRSNGDIAGKTSSWNTTCLNNSSDGKVKSSSEPSVNASFKFGCRTVTPEVRDEGAYSVPHAAAVHRTSPPPGDSRPITPQVFTLTLCKDPFYEDFGFSVSDGLYEKGVYVNRIRKGGPAYKSGLLRPYDRILQVNDTLTDDFDCCLTVPLIASAEDSLFLKVSRTNTAAFILVNDSRFNTWLEADDEDNGAPSTFSNKFP